MKNEEGFTLLEVVFALTIWTILITITVPIVLTNLNEHKEKEFIKILMSDILHVQTISHGTYNKDASIKFNETHYMINYRSNSNNISRPYPKGFNSEERTFNEVSFLNGTIRKAGTVLLRSEDTNYRIIFPFGKGRGYIEKQ